MLLDPPEIKATSTSEQEIEREGSLLILNYGQLLPLL